MLNYTCLHSKTCRQVFLIIQRNARHGADCEDVTMHKQVLNVHSRKAHAHLCTAASDK